MANEQGDARPRGMERHIQTLMLGIVLAVLTYIASQYASQGSRIAVAEQSVTNNANAITAANMRMQRLEDRNDDNMREIRTLVQQIYDRLDQKVDKR